MQGHEKEYHLVRRKRHVDQWSLEAQSKKVKNLEVKENSCE
jgi:hypothetical protein